MSSSTVRREPSITPSNSIAGVPNHILRLLDGLHIESAEQEARIRPDELQADSLAETTRGMFIALDQDKAQCIYALCRANDACIIFEAGTSFGVSTIYLALAAAANASIADDGRPARVIATKHEPTEAARARDHWGQCGEAVSAVVELREGDLLDTLKDDLGEVDLLLLDIRTPMSLPTLNLVRPSMRRGALVIADNTVEHAEGYMELLNYLRGPSSSFISVTLPYNNGLEMSIYSPP